MPGRPEASLNPWPSNSTLRQVEEHLPKGETLTQSPPKESLQLYGYKGEEQGVGVGGMKKRETSKTLNREMEKLGEVSI